MAQWSDDELKKIGESDDLHVSPFRDDGTTYGTPTWVWSVVVDGALYVRPYNGEKSRWYQAAIKQKAGRITAAGLTKEVSFELAEDDVKDAVDEAYKTKYLPSAYVKPMIGHRVRAVTVRISPRG
jgi:hypothetical protein